MAVIRLSDCDVVIISMADDHRRRAAVSSLCEELNLRYRIMDAVTCKPGWLGCGLSHVKALRQWDGARPLLVLEDDVAITDHYNNEITVPDGAEAVYLGITEYGAADQVDYVGFTNFILAEAHDDRCARIYNMLASHAILHISKAWAQAAIDVMLHVMLDKTWDPDRGLASIQPDHQIYALIEPFFYQCAALQSPEVASLREASTKITLPLHPIGTMAGLQIGDTNQPARLERVDGVLRWVNQPILPA